MQPRLLVRTFLIAGIAVLGAACDRGHAPTAPAPAAEPAAQAPAEPAAPAAAPEPAPA